MKLQFFSSIRKRRHPKRVRLGQVSILVNEANLQFIVEEGRETAMARKKTTVAVVFNHVGDDEYEKLRAVDPATLDFTPQYDIHVATVLEEYKAIVKSLKEEGYNASLYNIEDDFTKLRQLLEENPPDVVFNLVEIFGNNPRLESAVAGMYELYKIPYTGASALALALCQRKALTKQLLLANKVPTPRFKLLFTPKLKRRHGLRYPLIVKPAREDASSGITKGSVVFDQSALQGRIESAFAEFTPPIMVEEFIEGKEIHVSILGNEKPQVLPLLEYDFSELPKDHPAIISYEAKWNPLDEIFHKVHSVCPATVSKKVEKKVGEAALNAYRVTGARDYARIDIRLGKDNRPYVLEVNPNPDLTEGVSFMESAEKAGFTFSATLKSIVEFALARSVSVS